MAELLKSFGGEVADEEPAPTPGFAAPPGQPAAAPGFAPPPGQPGAPQQAAAVQLGGGQPAAGAIADLPSGSVPDLPINSQPTPPARWSAWSSTKSRRPPAGGPSRAPKWSR
nr:hypothetical protein [Fodinicola feengrottensis]